MQKRLCATSSLLLLLSCSFAACGGDDDANDAASPTRLVALHAEPDPVNGGRIVDAEGREVLLRGVNVNAFVEYWSSNEFPTTFPLTESDADLMAAIGWNTVRLLLSWSRVEPQPGEYDAQYLDEIEEAVGFLADRGIYSVIDLHQDAWSATLAARPDEMCEGNTLPAFGWDGAPPWATFDGGAERCAIAGIREANPAVQAAFQAFWENRVGPGGVGIRTRYTRMLAHVAGRFAHEAAVAGYDLMNEPNAFFPDQQALMAKMYSDAVREIRAAEDETGGFHHLLFFEPSALWSAFGEGPPPDFDRDSDVVYSPHIYTGGFDGGPITGAAFQVAVDEARRFGGAPIFSGEWGADPRRADNPDDGYFLTHQRLQDEFRIGAALWTWRESCGDPHKAGDYRAGTVPYVWGEFDVDCTTNEVTGLRDTLVDQLTRAYVRAAPGTITELEYDPGTGAFHVSGVEAPLETELVVFYPSAKHPTSPSPVVDGLDAPRVRLAGGGSSYITARTTASQWSLRIAAPD